MKIRILLIAAVISVATIISSQAEEQDMVGRKLARSIPEEVVFCARLDLGVVRKNEESKKILDTAREQFKEMLDSIGQFSALDLVDVERIWISVVKDKEALVILEGNFDADEILNSPVVTSSRKMARPGTLIAIEMKDEQKNELNYGVLINGNIVAFGLPGLVDKFISLYATEKTGWDKDGLAVMDSLAASDAMIDISVMHLPEQEIKEKPFLGNLVNAQLQVNMVEKKIAATAKLNMLDEEKAKAVKDLVSGIVVLGITSEIKVECPEIKKAILDGLKLGNEGRTATLSSGIGIDQLRDLLRSKGLDLK
ncbi:MAG TPA: hypothetical protein DET40_11915 [Lentisphaeria bacterium]|nr:MAG: hypothetical protein A2X45_16665 [Lentisphaerae bacterium GWF2_50_93]HCE44245.1 hypothetical protein [Lentisphaeria bacterium]